MENNKIKSYNNTSNEKLGSDSNNTHEQNFTMSVSEKEFETRRDRIDSRLLKAGWDVSDPSRIRLEIDTINSNFKTQDYKTKSDTLKTEELKAYADYLLLDSRGNPLAVIEAKKASKDPRFGQKQAEDYAADIKKQTNSDILIFYTNGIDIWFWNKGYDNPRRVLGFHSREDLERIVYQNNNKKEFVDIPLRDDIVNRPYQIESIKRILEGIDNGRRKFLLVQATGTGKTRVSMGLIDVMLNSKRIQRVLFLTDRQELRDQAYDENIMVFFPHEAKQKVFSETVDLNSRIYVSTLQTMENVYRKFSVGFFDLIISDEAHRSIFNKYTNLFQYFDAIQIGLTATPANMLSRNTYEFFECDEGDPTFGYEYDEAVKEGYLAPYAAYPVQTHFQLKGIRPEDVPNEEKERLLIEEGIEEQEIDFKGTDIENKVSVTGTNKAWIREFMDNCLTDDAGLPCKTIIFPVSIRHAKVILEEFEKMYPQYRGELVRIISSEDSRAKKLIKQFKKESLPRIAISVGILDTGVDIPEICNLVFARPTRSRIRFWQMIGRGTRHNRVCNHKEWLPSGTKEKFLIFDFMKNFERFEMNPEGDIPTPVEAIMTRLFMTRLKQYEAIKK
ncbi:Type I restriction enzyme EcoKI subunit R (fragment) [metagenome]